MTLHQETRLPFAANTTKADKRSAGRTDAAATPLEIRTTGPEIDSSLRSWIYERISRQLGKYATHIERIQVRFGDENGLHKGGVDKACMVHLILSKLPPVVVEVCAETERQAFDLAAGRAERATRHSVQKHGFSSRPAHKHADGHGSAQPAQNAEADDGQRESSESLFGRHVGHGTEQLLALAERPEKERRDVQVDTSEVGTSATDRKVGYGHTGARNTKLNSEGMSYRLEDSTNGRPSRKSTRGGNTTRQTRRQPHAPHARRDQQPAGPRPEALAARREGSAQRVQR
ncbi:MAG: hypothetical protein RLZZ450_5130 [Pseudomonadota bacterium]